MKIETFRGTSGWVSTRKEMGPPPPGVACNDVSTHVSRIMRAAQRNKNSILFAGRHVLLSCQLEVRNFGVYSLENIGVWLWLDTPRLESTTLIAFRMLASSTLITISSTAREYVFALVALVVWDRVGAELVAGIAEWVLILLRRISRAVCAADVAALASLVARSEERVAFVAGSSDTLSGLLVDEILATRLARSAQNGRR